MPEKTKSEHERVTILEEQMSEVLEELLGISNALQKLNYYIANTSNLSIAQPSPISKTTYGEFTVISPLVIRGGVSAVSTVDEDWLPQVLNGCTPVDFAGSIDNTEKDWHIQICNPSKRIDDRKNQNDIKVYVDDNTEGGMKIPPGQYRSVQGKGKKVYLHYDDSENRHKVNATWREIAKKEEEED